MRQSAFILAALLPLAAEAVGAENGFPYVAYVTGDDVYVRSGPGGSYYPTDKLRRGEMVEVWRHDPGGWYAIRPPQGSFTWVSARYVTPLGDGLGEVGGDRVAARVGSRFSEMRDVVQVRLHRGELVEILESPSDDSGGQGWYKITPPSGEFRWVFGRYLDPDYPADGLAYAPAAASPLLRPDRAATALPTDDGHSPGSGLGGLGAARPVAAGISDRYGSRAGPATEAQVEEPSLSPPALPRQLTAHQFEQQLADIDLELSIMVAEEPTVWQFDSLDARARTLFAQADTALERGRARVLLNKIARFEDIRQRYHVVHAGWNDNGQRNAQLAQLSQRRASAAGRSGSSPAAASAESERFDGMGRLTEVVSPKMGSPRYALIDERGEVLSYVTPAPGLNLRHYLGRRVGVSGTRGYIPEHRAQHVMTRQVTPLDGPLLR